jgi:hypothetical protein
MYVQSTRRVGESLLGRANVTLLWLGIDETGTSFSVHLFALSVRKPYGYF